MKTAIKNAQQELDYRFNRAWRTGCRRNYTLDEFKRQLLIIGLNVYEKQILPAEICEEYHVEEAPQGAKIIQFPGVTA